MSEGATRAQGQAWLGMSEYDERREQSVGAGNRTLVFVPSDVYGAILVAIVNRLRLPYAIQAQKGLLLPQRQPVSKTKPIDSLVQKMYSRRDKAPQKAGFPLSCYRQYLLRHRKVTEKISRVALLQAV